MLLRIHNQGKKPIRVAFILLVIANIPLVYFSHGLVTWIILLVSLCIMALVTQFFFDPLRVMVSPKKNTVYSPADGRIVNIQEFFESEYFNKEMIRISIFMNLFNVHLNRIPVSSDVIYQAYHPGKYFMAFHKKSSSLNENNAIALRDENNHELFVRQIAGFIARRIVSFVKKGENYFCADELGFIRFGSRVDIYLPLDTHIKVRLKDKVKAGMSQLAEFAS